MSMRLSIVHGYVKLYQRVNTQVMVRSILKMSTRVTGTTNLYNSIRMIESCSVFAVDWRVSWYWTDQMPSSNNWMFTVIHTCCLMSTYVNASQTEWGCDRGLGSISPFRFQWKIDKSFEFTSTNKKRASLNPIVVVSALSRNVHVHGEICVSTM